MTPRTLTCPNPGKRRTAPVRALGDDIRVVVLRTAFDWNPLWAMRRRIERSVSWVGIRTAHCGYLSGVLSDDPSAVQRKSDTTVLSGDEASTAALYGSRRG